MPKSILDGTMGNADEIFTMLCEYLSMLSIDVETEVLFISDGATWLWDRVHLVEKVVRNKGGRFRCLLDYYHMKGYLYDMAGAVKGWSKKKRTQWIGRLTKFLFAGDNKSFEREVRLLQRGSRKGSVLRTAGNYTANGDKTLLNSQKKWAIRPRFQYIPRLKIDVIQNPAANWLFPFY